MATLDRLQMKPHAWHTWASYLDHSYHIWWWNRPYTMASWLEVQLAALQLASWYHVCYQPVFLPSARAGMSTAGFRLNWLFFIWLLAVSFNWMIFSWFLDIECIESWLLAFRYGWYVNSWLLGFKYDQYVLSFDKFVLSSFLPVGFLSSGLSSTGFKVRLLCLQLCSKFSQYSVLCFRFASRRDLRWW